MDVSSLRWFQQVADGVTVTEVSDLEQLSQSGVSRALARLEAEVGVALLRRDGRVLRMTQAGATFKRYVDRSLHDLDDGFAALSALAEPGTGTVTVAFQPSLGSWLVPGLVAGFRATYPDVGFDLRQTDDERVGTTLARGDADVEITTVPATVDTIRWRPLLSEALQLAVPRDHPLAANSSATAPVSLSVVADEPFVMLQRRFVLRRTNEQLCERAGFTPRVAFEGDDLSTVTGFVAAGLGVAIVPLPHGELAAGRSVRYLAIDDRAAARQIGLAWSTERRLLPSAENFRRHVMAELPRR